MDPQACLTRLLTAYLDNDRGEWEEARGAYNKWRGRGGFMGTMYSGFAVDEVLGFGLLQLIPAELGTPSRVVMIAPPRYGEQEEGTEEKEES